MIPLGCDAKAYLLTTGPRATWGALDTAGVYHVGAAPTGLVELKIVKDIALPFNKGDADVSTRGNGRYAATQGGQRKLKFELPMVYDKSDAGFQALLAAWITDATVAIVFLDGADTVSGSVGFWADFSVMDANKDEKMTDAQSITFSVTPGYSAVAPEWVKVSGGSGSGS